MYEVQTDNPQKTVLGSNLILKWLTSSDTLNGVNDSNNWTQNSEKTPKHQKNHQKYVLCVKDMLSKASVVDDVKVGFVFGLRH